MSFINSEQASALSGVGWSHIIGLGDQKATAVATSGSQVNISGAGLLVAVVGIGGTLLSGVSTAASQSGATVVIVDGVSGVIVVVQSGANTYASNTAGVLYQFSFGNASGTATGGVATAPTTVYGINAVFRSGLNVVCSGGTAGGFGVSVIYQKAV